MGDAGEAASAALYVSSNVYSWKEARKMPERQAEANEKVLTLQKKHYDAISKEQRDILNAAINTYLSNVNSLLSSGEFERAYASVPAAAEYVPVDACCVQGSTIDCNISHTDRANEYVSYVNRLHEQNDLVHVLSMDPRFMATLDIQSQSIQDMTRGILTTGDVVEVMSDNAEQASLTGRIGATKRTTARDLGISKMRAQSAGRKEFRESVAWMNSAVSPLQRQLSIRESMLSPQERIQLALQQSQLIQQSLQNKNNALAQKSPYLLAKLQMRIQQYITRLQAKSSEALLVNTHVPNYAAIVPPPTMNNISELVGGIGQAIQQANTSHFFGPPTQSQEGYLGGRTGESKPTT
jgi:predicted RNase H-like nuclease (RuvC/YqgF family)